jgi:hypothetical protein
MYISVAKSVEVEARLVFDAGWDNYMGEGFDT